MGKLNIILLCSNNYNDHGENLKTLNCLICVQILNRLKIRFENIIETEKFKFSVDIIDSTVKIVHVFVLRLPVTVYDLSCE